MGKIFRVLLVGVLLFVASGAEAKGHKHAPRAHQKTVSMVGPLDFTSGDSEQQAQARAYLEVQAELIKKELLERYPRPYVIKVGMCPVGHNCLKVWTEKNLRRDGVVRLVAIDFRESGAYELATSTTYKNGRVVKTEAKSKPVRLPMVESCQPSENMCRTPTGGGKEAGQ